MQENDKNKPKIVEKPVAVEKPKGPSYLGQVVVGEGDKRISMMVEKQYEPGLLSNVIKDAKKDEGPKSLCDETLFELLKREKRALGTRVY